MKITELLSKETIILQLKAKSKTEVLDELIEKLYDSGCLNSKQEYKNAILKREEESSTGIGDGIAIPHAMSTAVKRPALAFGYSAEGVYFDSLDDEPAHIFFMIAGAQSANNEHLETVSRLSIILMDEDFRKGIKNVTTKDDLLDLINKKDNESGILGENQNVSNSDKAAAKLVLAVTACPTGIAHTYMAADSLAGKAKELDNVKIKVETNGATGAKNVLTNDEIRNAAAIIVAADKQVEMARFEGKKVLMVPVSKAIKDPKGLIEKALSDDTPVYHHGNTEKTGNYNQKERTGFYKHLMNGVSNMLPFVVGGGILIAICFLFGIKSFDPKDPHYNWFAKLLMDIGGGNAFSLMVPVLAGFIGMSIADRPGFAPAMVGGLIAANNGAGFLGGLVAGFLGGYTVVGLKKLFAGLPESLEGIKPVLLYPLFGIFITGAIMFLAIVGPVKTINTDIGNWLASMGTANKVFLGLILGGMMAIDMGGPINKAAFAFGIAMISSGHYAPHAAIMAGGMVPPLGIAIATTIFRNRFTREERDAGKTCYILGATFITEGAIPFAAADPGRVLPATIIGSAVAGALTMMFNIGLPAPHGGIFVIPIVKGNPLLYVAAILVGSFVTAFLLGIFKKPIVQE